MSLTPQGDLITRHSETNTYIKYDNEILYGGERLVMLGFCLGRSPDAGEHVKFFAKVVLPTPVDLSVLRNLKNANVYLRTNL